MPLPRQVKIVEVGPRDGLQNEAVAVSTANRIALIDRLADAGLRVVEAGSFVSPKWVPQMADTAAVLAGITRREGVSYPVLVPNMTGFDAALAAGAGEVAIFAAASETFSRRNINCSIAESLERFAPVCDAARRHDIRVRGYVSCVLGCPYEGAVDTAVVADVSRWLAELGCYEISLGDTIGVGTPQQVRSLVGAVAGMLPVERIALHLHDTYGRALANVQAGYEAGVRTFDASLGGLGGCPYAPGASGNVATEDVVDLFERSGVSTGIELGALVEAASWLEDEVLGRPLPGRVYRALRGARRRQQEGGAA